MKFSSLHPVCSLFLHKLRFETRHTVGEQKFSVNLGFLPNANHQLYKGFSAHALLERTELQKLSPTVCVFFVLRGFLKHAKNIVFYMVFCTCSSSAPLAPGAIPHGVRAFCSQSLLERLELLKLSPMVCVFFVLRDFLSALSSRSYPPRCACFLFSERTENMQKTLYFTWCSAHSLLERPELQKLSPWCCGDGGVGGMGEAL